MRIAELTDHDVRDVFRTLGELREDLPATGLGRVETIHSHATALLPDTRVIAGVMRLSRARSPEQPVSWSVLDATTVGFDDKQMGLIQQAYLSDAIYRDDLLPTAVISATARDGLALARRRRTAVTDHQWYGHPLVMDLRRLLGVDDNLVLAMPAGRDLMLCLGLSRPWGGRAFSSRDQAVAQLLAVGLTPLARVIAHEACPASNLELPRLSPRLAQTLHGLLSGRSEAQVALALGVSRHTAHEYVKEVYKRLGVASRAELMARFVQVQSGV